MYKIFLPLILGSLLSAEVVNGVAIVVKGEPITLHEVREEMRISKVDSKTASDILIRKRLEEVEVQERKLSVSSSEVYDDIKKTAARNNMSVSEFYEAIRSSNGMSSSELKTKTKEKLLSQKLYATIAYSSMSQPSDEETLEYYELHKKDFEHPAAFEATIYSTKDKDLLVKKITNPMFYSSSISQSKQRLEYNKISPELAKFLAESKVNSFTPMIPDGKGAYMSFYITKIEEGKKRSYEDVKDQIANIIMGDKREQVLSDYFARLKGNADIKVIREVE